MNKSNFKLCILTLMCYPTGELTQYSGQKVKKSSDYTWISKHTKLCILQSVQMHKENS